MGKSPISLGFVGVHHGYGQTRMVKTNDLWEYSGQVSINDISSYGNVQLFCHWPFQACADEPAEGNFIMFCHLQLVPQHISAPKLKGSLPSSSDMSRNPCSGTQFHLGQCWCFSTSASSCFKMKPSVEDYRIQDEPC